jgi:hypothetical protein
MDWDNKQKLTTLFHSYAEQKEPLPAYGVNDQGDALIKEDLVKSDDFLSSWLEPQFRESTEGI